MSCLACTQFSMRPPVTLPKPLHLQLHFHSSFHTRFGLRMLYVWMVAPSGTPTWLQPSIDVKNSSMIILKSLLTSLFAKIISLVLGMTKATPWAHSNGTPISKVTTRTSPMCMIWCLFTRMWTIDTTFSHRSPCLALFRCWTSRIQLIHGQCKCLVDSMERMP